MKKGGRKLPILMQGALHIFAVIFGPMPAFEPCYSDHFRHTESPFLAIAQALVALWSPQPSLAIMEQDSREEPGFLVELGLVQSSA